MLFSEIKTAKGDSIKVHGKPFLTDLAISVSHIDDLTPKGTVYLQLNDEEVDQLKAALDCTRV